MGFVTPEERLIPKAKFALLCLAFRKHPGAQASKPVYAARQRPHFDEHDRNPVVKCINMPVCYTPEALLNLN